MPKLRSSRDSSGCPPSSPATDSATDFFRADEAPAPPPAKRSLKLIPPAPPRWLADAQRRIAADVEQQKRSDERGARQRIAAAAEGATTPAVLEVEAAALRRASSAALTRLDSTAAFDGEDTMRSARGGDSGYDSDSERLSEECSSSSGGGGSHGGGSVVGGAHSQIVGLLPSSPPVSPLSPAPASTPPSSAPTPAQSGLEVGCFLTDDAPCGAADVGEGGQGGGAGSGLGGGSDCDVL